MLAAKAVTTKTDKGDVEGGTDPPPPRPEKSPVWGWMNLTCSVTFSKQLCLLVALQKTRVCSLAAGMLLRRAMRSLHKYLLRACCALAQF